MSAELQAALDGVAVQQPLLHRLAMFASLAVRIEPPLLRRLRQQLLDDAEPGLEADLWFSPLVESFDSDACVLYPWVAEQLRTGLRDSGRLAEVWAIMAEAHVDAPAAQRIEEQVAYLALQGDTGAAAAALRGALKAMLASPERGVAVARWAMHALPRLPSQLADAPEVRALEQGMHARIAVIGSASGWRESPLFDHARDGWVLPAPTTVSSPVHVGLHLDGLALRVVDAAEVAEEAQLAIPDTRTRRLQVRATDGAGHARYAALRGRPGERLAFDAAPVDIEITTEAGEVLGVEPVVPPPREPATELHDAPEPASAYSCALYICSSGRDREWVSGFREAFDQQWRQRTGAAVLPSFHYRDVGLQPGTEWVDEMEVMIKSAFAFVLVVNEASVDSEWCRREFEIFANHTGAAERVYVVALSEPAIQRWQADPFWRDRIGQDRAWLPFFDERQRDQPLVRSDAYFQRLRGLVSDIARHQQTAPQPTPQPNVLIGVVSLELDGPTMSLRRRLRQRGVQVRSLNREALHGAFPEFASADLLLLPFNGSQPMVSTIGIGGHLSLQRDAWLRHGKRVETIIFVDMRDVPPAQPLLEAHAGFVAEIARGSVRAEAVLARLSPAGEIDEPAALRIVIDDDPVNLRQWRVLDESLRRRWAVLQHERFPAQPPLALRSLRLRLDREQGPESFDDVDAMVFVWTDQTFEAMQARVEQTESRLPDAVPGLAVCLSPPHPLDRWPPPLVGCTTLRFDATDESAFDVVADDVERLDRFLLAAMAHRQRSTGGSPPA